jgi:hypothetical protein
MSERLADLAIRECVGLHEFFLAWLRPHNGTKLDPARFERAFDPAFRLVGPDGGVRDRAAIVGWLHDLKEGRGADFRMEVSDSTRSGNRATPYCWNMSRHSIFRARRPSGNPRPC